MKIFVDENIPCLTVKVLRDAGHDVLDIRDSENQGLPDNLLWERCQREARMLITTDMGFAYQHRRESHYGVLAVRLKQPNRRKIHERVMLAMTKINTDWRNQIVIVQDHVQRIWK